MPDCFIPIPMVQQGLFGNKYKGGLWIEFKVGSNKPSPEQANFMSNLRKKGYEVAVCYTLEEAIDTLKKYLGTLHGH